VKVLHSFRFGAKAHPDSDSNWRVGRPLSDCRYSCRQESGLRLLTCASDGGQETLQCVWGIGRLQPTASGKNLRQAAKEAARRISQNEASRLTT
jgi:hypothetical protein